MTEFYPYPDKKPSKPGEYYFYYPHPNFSKKGKWIKCLWLDTNEIAPVRTIQPKFWADLPTIEGLNA